jgi:hypothetical protein
MGRFRAQVAKLGFFFALNRYFADDDPKSTADRKVNPVQQ